MFRRSSNDGPATLPPWAHQNDVFSDLCDGCAECVTACPQDMLSVDHHNRAIANFKNSFCDFCGECENACPTKALNRELNSAWAHKAKFDAKCLSFKGVVCRLCEEGCEAQAIRFRLVLDGRSVPLIDTDKCDGCGGCQTVCPADAVRFTQSHKEPQS